jgi:molybdenum cofactor cytidylyltransferase
MPAPTIGKRALAWNEVGLVLLAGGRASRFGSDKLAATLNGMPLLGRTMEIYAALPLRRGVVVLGPSAPPLPRPAFPELRLERADLPQSASLAAGVAALDSTDLRAILVALADMPLVSEAHLERLRAAFEDGQASCSAAGEIRCPPALFPIGQREELCRLEGDRGAKALLLKATVVVAPPEELLDIDTPADLARAESVHARRGASAKP